jgi:uncharacterized protein
MLFLDASALVKRYVREEHTATVRRLMTAGPIAISRLSDVEVPSALARLLRKRRLTPRAADRALRAFTADLGAWHIVEITPEVTALARGQLLRHDLRAGDAIQLASAIWLRQGLEVKRLLAFDTRVAAAALAEGFATEL